MAPATTIGPARLSGRMVQKDRVIFLTCTNFDGLEKFPLLLVGGSKQPKCSGSDDPESLEIMYRHNSLA